MAYTGDPENNTLDAVRLEINDTDPVQPFLTDGEVQYFLNKNNSSVRKASLDAAKIILFKLSGIVREKTFEIEYYGNQYFTAYRDALKMYINNPAYGAVSIAVPYAGGISRSDIRSNINTTDNFIVPVENGIPTDYYSYNVNNDSPFKDSSYPRDGAFSD